ncbi:hydroxyacylglutathione hydrolase [Candidatus Thiodiazotropha sp. LNASS1]|uniref:hydroxyacylglutathione hydrolase n=1 Tax=Candidatus Thiodiazotropha sp. LNASS1 TaxID=3096260 RepID=UPI0034DF3078
MIEITGVTAFEDNYIWMVKNPASSQVVAVDPGDETPVLSWLEQQDCNLSAILITHHHYDHVGGIAELREAYPDIEVYGPANESIRGVTHPLEEGDRPRIAGLNANLQVLEVPGHTQGHIAYFGEGALFCGDTLFTAGCGRVFSGTFEQLSDSLQRIAALPGDTSIYCAHEYTLANLGFAAWVEPENPELAIRIKRAREKRQAGIPTVPSDLAEELMTNPFMRTSVQSVVKAAEQASGLTLSSRREVFTALRRWKDTEYD